MKSHPLAAQAAILLKAIAAISISNLPRISAITIPIGNDASINPPSIGWTEGVCYTPLGFTSSEEGAKVYPGDELLFEFGAHNVYQLASKAHFDNCDFNDAILLAQVGGSPYTFTIPDTDEISNDANDSTEGTDGVLYFACQVGDHCAGGTQKIQVGVSAMEDLAEGDRVVPVSSYSIGVSSEECMVIQENQGLVTSETSDTESSESSEALRSFCSEPVLVEDAEPHTYYTTCLSPPATLTPGGVVNRLFIMQDPFPQDYRVVIGQRTFEFVSGDPITDSSGNVLSGITPVPVNQLYVHHLSGRVIFGQGSEGIRQTAPDAPFAKPYGVLSGNDGNSMVFHLIDLRQVEDWLGCIECRCPADQQAPGTYLDELTMTGNITGGVNCCSNCTDLEGPTVDYRMRYNVTYRELQPDDEKVTDVMMLTADISPVAGGILEHDVPSSEYLPVEHVSPDDPHVQRLEIIQPFNELFKEEFFQNPYSGPTTVKLLRCVAHLHVAAIEMYLEDISTGERICDGQTVYGTDPTSDQGFLTAVSVSEYDPPREFAHDLQVRFVTDYNATQIHTGVMGYWFLFVGGENEVGYDETPLTVEFCAPDVCDATLLPSMDLSPFLELGSSAEERVLQTRRLEQLEGRAQQLRQTRQFRRQRRLQTGTDPEAECEDTIAASPVCEFGGICECESFVAAPESTGCSGFYTSAWGEIEVRSVCANYCGCVVSAAVEEAVGSAGAPGSGGSSDSAGGTVSDVSAVATAEEECMDALPTHPSCTFGGLCDCEAFVNAEESTGCGGVYSSPMGDVKINSVCNKYCGCADASAVATVEVDCVDALASHPSCTFGGLCDCEVFVNAEESTGCGGVYSSPMGDVKVNSVCNKYCGCPAGAMEGGGSMVNVPGAPDNAEDPSSSALLGACTDTIENHPACRFGGVCSCEEFVSAPESEGCGGLWKSEMGDTVINDVCALYCDACVDKSVEELFEEAYSEVVTLTMQEHCKYATEECEQTLANLYSCSQEYPGIENVDPYVRSFVVKHGEEMAIENAKLGHSSLHVGEEDPVIEPCSVESVEGVPGAEETPGSTGDKPSGDLSGEETPGVDFSEDEPSGAAITAYSFVFGLMPFLVFF